MGTNKLTQSGLKRLLTSTLLLMSAFSILTLGGLAGCSDDGANNGSPGGSINTPPTFSIGGNVTGLSGTVVLQNNAGDNLALNTDGSFAFPTAIADSSAYAVTILSQPAGQTCTVSLGSGSLNGADVNDVELSCVTQVPLSLSIGGTLSGLASGAVILQNNAGDNLALNTNGSFNFATSIAEGLAYNVTILSQPAGQTCSVLNGSGNLAGQNVSDVSVVCVTNTVSIFTVGGTLNGLSSGNLVLQDNVGDNLSLSADGAFTFPTSIADNSSYTVTVLSQPIGQVCSITNGVGTINGGNISNVDVFCVPMQVSVFTVGGTLSGLTSGTVVLQNNAGDTLSLSADGSFNFANSLADGSAYNVTVSAQPAGQTCAVTNGSGTLSGANVSDVTVNCATVASYSVSGNLSGLVANTTLTIQNMSGNAGDFLFLNADGPFTFNNPLADGSTYAVSIFGQPAGQICTVTNSNGTLSGANVSDVVISCNIITTFTVGGTLSGLTSGTVVLQNNAGDDLSLSADGSFDFINTLNDGSAYTVTIFSQPAGQTCTVTNGNGSLSGANVIDVTVNCGIVVNYSVGGNLSGLAANSLVVLMNTDGNANDFLFLSADGPFTFNNVLADGSTYAVSMFGQPNGQTCSVAANASGILSGANVNNVSVLCVASGGTTFTLGGTLSGLTSGTLVLEDNTGDHATLSADGSFTFVTPFADGLAYTVTVFSQPAGQTCTVTNGSGNFSGADVSNVSVSCTPDQVSSFTIGGTLSALAANSTVVLQNTSGGVDDFLFLSADGLFSFNNLLADGADYNVTIFSQPAGQTCTVTNASGILSGANINTVDVSCL